MISKHVWYFVIHNLEPAQLHVNSVQIRFIIKPPCSHETLSPSASPHFPSSSALWRHIAQGKDTSRFMGRYWHPDVPVWWWWWGGEYFSTVNSHKV